MPFLHERPKQKPWKKIQEEKSFRTGLRQKIFFPEGGYYKGDWGRGYRTGKGLELLSSGLQYEGDWACNKKHGFGVRSQFDDFEKSFNLVYLGDHKNDKKHGYGCLHYEDGTFYEGEFKCDKRHGYGRCWFKDGSYYEGYWVKDLQQGFGMNVQANGNRYEGEWHAGNKHGWGLFYHLKSGQKQSGYWENDICTTSTLEDITYRQASVNPTPYPIQKLELHPNTPFLSFLGKAEKMILQYKEGCQLHKYCYKIPETKSGKDLSQDTEPSPSISQCHRLSLSFNFKELCK